MPPSIPLTLLSRKQVANELLNISDVKASFVLTEYNNKIYWIKKINGIVEIANYSFGDGAPGKLKSITIGKGVSLIGSMNAGYGHRSDNSGRLSLASGDLFYMRGLMGFAGEINIADGNSSFVQTADAIYSADGKVLHFVTDRALQTFSLPETVETLDVGAFFGCERMREVSLGVSVKEVRSFAFGYCASLQVLKYSGSEAEFRKIVLQTNTILSVCKMSSIGFFRRERLSMRRAM